MNPMRAVLLSSALLTLPLSAMAAEVGSGTLTLANPELSFSGGPIVGTNATNAAGVQCVDPILPCDSYALTVELPEDTLQYFPTALVRVLLGPTDSPTGADDYDLHLYDESGTLIAESTSATATESVSTIAFGGVRSYTVEVSHWLVIGGSYQADLQLSLGVPSEDKTDAEVAAWLEENGAPPMGDARALASCAYPGQLLQSDASGDVDALGLGLAPGMPLDMFDIEEVSVFQTGSLDDPEDPALIGFRMKVAALDSLLPNSAYFISFARGFGGTIVGVRMSVDQSGAESFFSYIAGPNNDGGVDGRFVEDGTQVPAEAGSSYSSDGEIVIFVKPQTVGLLMEGDQLLDFNAATTFSAGVPGVGGISGTMDEAPNGLGRSGQFIFRTAEECDAGDASRGDTYSTPSRSFGSRGGAAGWPALLLIALFGLRRRQA